MGNQSSRVYYVGIEGGIYSGTLVLSFAVLTVTLCCLAASERVRTKCLSLYSLVFKNIVKETSTEGKPDNEHSELFQGSKPDNEHAEYLFEGCKYEKSKSKCCLHAYFTLMIFVATNWFFIMFVDNFLYRKSTTCNDLNVRNDDYSCFDVKIHSQVHQLIVQILGLRIIWIFM